MIRVLVLLAFAAVASSSPAFMESFMNREVGSDLEVEAKVEPCDSSVSFIDREVPLERDDVEQPTIEREGRIIGGANAPLGRFPYVVAIRNSNNQYRCAGSIINNRWVLAAAQCTAGLPQNGLRIVVGTVNWSSGGTVHNSVRYVMHPIYCPNVLRGDLSVIQTATAIAFNANVGPIPLGSNAIGGGVNALTMGWGGTVGRTNLLQQLSVTTITNADCRNRYGSWGEFIFDPSLCTITPNTQGNTARDMGNPLVAGNQLIGHASWTYDNNRYPDVYIRTANFRSWILTTIA